LRRDLFKVLLSSAVTLIVAGIIWDLTFQEAFILALELFFLFYFLDHLGRKFVFLELLALIGITQWLFGPMIARRIGISLSVPFDTYFNYALPATVAYVIGVTVPLWNQRKLDQRIAHVLDKLSTIYEPKYKLGILLFLIGVPFWVFQNSVPVSISFIFNLLSSLFMVGITLLMFTKYKWKWIWIGLGLLLLVVTTFLNGVIGILLIWMYIILMTYTSKFPIRIPLTVKIVFFMSFVWVLTVLQAAKVEYRVLTWNIKSNEMTGYSTREIDQDPELFYKLIREKMFDLSTFSDKKSLTGLAIRLNQGLLVSDAMDYVPRRRAYGLGEATLLTTAVAFVPRILWPDKPVIGQAEHFKKYTGIKLTKFTSATIGPIGDAYVDFGYGGILFLFLYGGVIAVFFTTWINYASKSPGLLLWFMVIYFATIGEAEITVAVFLNALFKFFVFIVTMRWILSQAFKIKV